jgi:hypothetical protein
VPTGTYEIVTSAPEVEAGNRFSVVVRNSQEIGHGMQWSVSILDPERREVAVRACRDETEAMTFASTVRQHIAWLSEARFREIYLLAEGA